MNWHRLASIAIGWIIWVVYFTGALMFAGYASQHEWGTPLVIIASISFVALMMVSMGWLFSLFPKKIRKYWENKSPDNPDGYG